jgi:hypothetical protein
MYTNMKKSQSGDEISPGCSLSPVRDPQTLLIDSVSYDNIAG